MTNDPVSGVLAVVRTGSAATSSLGIGRDPDVLGGEAAYQEHGLQGDRFPCLLGGRYWQLQAWSTFQLEKATTGRSSFCQRKIVTKMFSVFVDSGLDQTCEPPARPALGPCKGFC